MASSFKDQDIISINDFSQEQILNVLRHAANLKKKAAPNLLQGKVLGSCFYEPSTRTRLSFETAMERMGGSIVGFADPSVTSVKKKETLHDTMRIIPQYADVIVLRHPWDGSARAAAAATNKPVINAGDGSNQHPSQTLLDLFTIQETQKKLTDLSVALVGDLKYGRTVHSLAQGLTHFNAQIYCVADDQLQMPSYVLDELKAKKIKYSLHRTIEEIIPKVDILYMTRIQEERFPDPADFQRVKNSYVLTAAMLSAAKPNLRVLHPLPRVNEISTDVDTTPYAYYFEQAENGLFVRQALLGLVLGKL